MSVSPTRPGGALIPYPKAPTATLALARQGEIVPVESPDAEVADGFLRLASHLLLRAQREDFRTVGVVSALPEEGKTTAALNLAICLGRTEGASGRILLVDGDRRSRSLTKYLGGVEGGNGTTSQQPGLRITGYQGVDLLTTPSQSDLLALHDPDVCSEMLGALRRRYRLILVDCPSILGSPEGLVMPSCVERLLMVVRSGHTPRETVNRALQALPRAPIGVILNGTPKRK